MKIRKAFQGTVPDNKILDTYSTSQTDTYSCNYVNSMKLVKEVELTSASGNINIDGLDLASDGGIYEIYFQGKNCSNASGIFMKINGTDSNSSVYQEYATSVNLTQRVNRIGRTNGGSSLILINISLTNDILVNTRGTDSVYGFIGNLFFNQSNVTSLQFYPEIGTFGTGTKIRIYKK